MVRGRHRFGGSWTEAKLERVSAYLHAYTTLMKKNRLKKIYVDAFAGTGTRTSGASDETTATLFEMPEVEDISEGSARRALQVDPPFDEYIFIEKSQAKLENLQSELETYSTMQDRIRLLGGDANTVLAGYCRAQDWRFQRAVLFLDPYGMQVDWSTLEAVATTKAMDVWLLVLIGIGFLRMLPHHGRLDPAWEARLDRALGEPDWRTEFYAEQENTTLFGEPVVDRRRTANLASIDRYLHRRLASIFPGVVERGYPLVNSRGNPMYMLTFACANPNPNALEKALKIASYVLKR